MRIARFVVDSDPLYGVVEGESGSEEITVIKGDPFFNGVERTAVKHKLEDVRLLAPIIPRSKVIGVGRNFAEHAAELGNEVPQQPLLFLKPNTAVIGPERSHHPAGVLRGGLLRSRAVRSHRPDLQGRSRGPRGRRDLRLHLRQRPHRPRRPEDGSPVGPGQGVRYLRAAGSVDRNRAGHRGPASPGPAQRRTAPGRQHQPDDPRRPRARLRSSRRPSPCSPATSS